MCLKATKIIDKIQMSIYCLLFWLVVCFFSLSNFNILAWNADNLLGSNLILWISYSYVLIIPTYWILKIERFIRKILLSEFLYSWLSAKSVSWFFLAQIAPFFFFFFNALVDAIASIYGTPAARASLKAVRWSSDHFDHWVLPIGKSALTISNTPDCDLTWNTGFRPVRLA